MGSSSAPRADRAALFAALLLFAVLALFGARYHWVEEAGTAERDGYVRQADALLAGELPRDPYRPLLYPLATAALARLTGDTFAAARLLSNFAAAALAWLAYAYGRRLAGPAAGGWAMALAAVNPNLWILGQHTTTDMLFGALAAAALLAGLDYLLAGGLRAALAAGLFLGLAAFTRANALFLLLPLLAAWWLAPRARRRLLHLATAAALAVAVLLPHWGLRQAAFGSPFYDENWKNLAFKLHGYPDWSYLERVPYRGALEVVRENPGAVLAAGWSELVRFATAGGAQLLGTWPHFLLFLIGAALALARRRGPALWLLGACAFFLAATALTFFTWGRLLLLLLPPACGFTGVLLAPGLARRADQERHESGNPRYRRMERWALTALAVLGSALVLVLAVKTFALRLPAFVANHPYLEVATLRRLDAALPSGSALGGTSPFLGRYLRHRYVDLPDAFGAEIAHPERYYARLGHLLAGRRVAYLVIGAVDLRDRPATLLGGPPPVPWLAPAASRRGVTVWRLTPEAPAAAGTPRPAGR